MSKKQRKGEPKTVFGKPKSVNTTAAAVAAAEEVGYPVSITIFKASIEEDPPNTPCDDADTVTRFLQHWSFDDNKDRAEVRSLRWK